MGNAPDIFRNSLSPALEIGAYEDLWAQSGQTFKSLAKLFQYQPAPPSQFVAEDSARARYRVVSEELAKRNVANVGVLVAGTYDYPQVLRDAAHPVQLLYYRGDLSLLDMPQRVAVVGSRNASDEGLRRTRKLVRCLVEDNCLIVSGLAAGVDTAAHETALAAGGRTAAVIGTPVTEVYPKQNAELQERIATEHLLLSQVPIIRYGMQGPMQNRLFFPERNVTMSAITQATVIVEAGDTSGTLIQARAALKQGRKLFILDSCFERGLKWPKRYAEQGAIRVREYDDIRRNLIGGAS